LNCALAASFPAKRGNVSGGALVSFGWGGLHALYNLVLVGLAVAGRVKSTVSVAEAAPQELP